MWRYFVIGLPSIFEKFTCESKQKNLHAFVAWRKELAAIDRCLDRDFAALAGFLQWFELAFRLRRWGWDVRRELRGLKWSPQWLQDELADWSTAIWLDWIIQKWEEYRWAWSRTSRPKFVAAFRWLDSRDLIVSVLVTSMAVLEAKADLHCQVWSWLLTLLEQDIEVYSSN